MATVLLGVVDWAVFGGFSGFVSVFGVVLGV
jgi:hypothetical protein